MNGKREVIENGAVAVRGSEIAWVGKADQVAIQGQPVRTFDASGMLVIPGLVNAHSHLAMTIFRGLVDDQPLEAWLERIWPLEAVYATEANVRAGVQLALAEMIRGGITCAADMYWQLHAATQVAREANFRLVNGPTFTEIVGPDGIMPENRESRARAYLEKYLDDPLVRCCIQVHSTYTASRAMLEQAQRLAGEYQLPFITHASESKVEVETVSSRFGMTPIEYLDSLGLLEAGVPVALGTDCAATNNDLDMFGEMRTAALIHKGVSLDPTVMNAEEVFAMATINGARALGLAGRIGSLELGKLADIALVSLASAHMMPHYNVYSQLVYAANNSDVTGVMIHGRPVMEDRQLLTLDEEAIKSSVRDLAATIGGRDPAGGASPVA